MKEKKFPFGKYMITLFTLRSALVIGILVFTVFVGKSQTPTSNTSTKQSTKIESVKPGSGNSLTNNSTITSNNKTVATPQKVAEHAPSFNDPDYESKKIEWMNNYPDEYNACQQKSTEGTSPVITQPVLDAPKKVAEHAPYFNDTDYATKKAEWIENYPEEYLQLQNRTSEPSKEKNE